MNLISDIGLNNLGESVVYPRFVGPFVIVIDTGVGP